MGATNFTSHYDLPQFVANDKPSWLGDVNGAFLKIDTAIADASATAQSANSAATSAQTQVANLSTQLGTVEGKANAAVTTATTADGKATTAQEVASAASVAAGEAKTAAESAVPLSGGTMTGKLILSGAPTDDLGAATKAYVDANGGGGISAVVLTPNSTNVQTVGTQFRANCRKSGKVYNFNFYIVQLKSTRAAISGYDGWYEICTVDGDPFGLSNNTTGNIFNCYVGSTFDGTGTGNYPICLYHNGTNTSVITKVTTTGFTSVGSLSFTLVAAE